MFTGARSIVKLFKSSRVMSAPEPLSARIPSHDDNEPGLPTGDCNLTRKCEKQWRT
jgi:hypothetical protein